MTILTVGIDKQFTTIKSAFNYAFSGDTLLIDEGEYPEVLRFKNKVVNLVGNTEFPLNGNVVVIGNHSGDASVYDIPLEIEYSSSNPSMSMYIEGIKFSAIVEEESIIKFYTPSSQTSNLSVIFNKCIIDGTNGVDYGLIGIGYDYPISSLSFINCKLLWNSSDKFTNNDSYFSNIPNKVISKSMVSRSLSTALNFDTRDYVSLDNNVRGYGPKYNTNFTSVLPTHCFSGIVTVNDVPVQRELRFFRRDNDTYLSSTTSSGATGFYYNETSFGGQHDIICLDDVATPDYNDLIMAKCIPVPLEQTTYVNSPNLFIMNPGAEHGDTIGWAIEEGVGGVIKTPGYNSISSFGRKDSTGLLIMSQRIDLVGHGATISGIDEGVFDIHNEAMIRYEDGTYATIKVGSRLLDSAFTIIRADKYNDSLSYTKSWALEKHVSAVISGTRYIDLLFYLSNSSYWVSSYFDDVRCFLRTSAENKEKYLTDSKIHFCTLTNPNAEIGDLSGWVEELGSWGVSSNVGVDASKCFTSASDQAEIILRQRVDLVGEGYDLTLLDTEKIEFSVSSAMRTATTTVPLDQSYLGLRFLDNNLASLGSTYYIGPFENYDYELKQCDRTAVSGTRYVDILLRGVRNEGDYPLTRYDHVRLWSIGDSIAQLDRISFTLQNPIAETNDTTGWSIEEGGFGTRTGGLVGDYYFFAGSFLDSIMSQRIDLVSEGVSASMIDDEHLKFNLSTAISVYNQLPADEAYLGFRFLDASFDSIGTDYYIGPFTNISWMYKTCSSTLVSGTRYVDILLRGHRNSGTVCDAYFDDVTAWTYVLE